MRARFVALLVAAGLVAAGCASDQHGGADVPPSPIGGSEPTPTATSEAPTGSPGTPPAASIDDVRLRYRTVVEGLDRPTGVTAIAGDDRLFVLEQPGRIQVVQPDGSRSVFLDLTDRVEDGGNEQGLLGMAFHPDEPDRFFVDYTGPGGETFVDAFQVSPDDRDRADPATRTTLLNVAQPAANHNGGTVTFDPGGYLVVSFGDGGAAGDRFGNGQNPSTLLATLARIDVDGDGPDGYAVPPDNPWAEGGPGAPEVWAYGLRNPWRVSFDAATNGLYIADVGQGSWEELNVVPADEPGLNFGWPITEGTHCYDPPSGCDTSGLTLPQVEYPLHEGGTCAIVGGHVYRGQAIEGLVGHYLYSDHCGGFLRSLRWTGEQVVDQRDWTEQVGRLDGVTSFGVGGDGELYVTARDGGRVLQLVPAS